MRSTSDPTARATAIAEGLVRTGRGAIVNTLSGFICVRGTESSFYWVSFDGARVLRGNEIGTADELQSGFVDAMERAGAPAR
jgi:hypothetical protein